MGTSDHGMDFANFDAAGPSAIPAAPRPSKSFDSDFASAFTNSSGEDQSTSQLSKSSGSKRQTSNNESRPQWGSRSFSAFDYRHQDEFDIFGNSDSKSVSSSGRGATLDDIFASSEKPPMTSNNKKSQHSDDRSVNSSTIEEVVRKEEIEAMFGMAFKNDDNFGEDASLADDIDSRDGTTLTRTSETKDGSSNFSAEAPKTPLSNPLGGSDDESDESEGSMERRKKDLRQKHFKLNFPDQVNDLESSPKSLDLAAKTDFDPFSLGSNGGKSEPMSFHSSIGPNGFAADFLVGSSAPEENSNSAAGKWVMDSSSSQRARGVSRASTGRGLARNRSGSISAHNRDRDDLEALVAGSHRPRAVSRQRSRMRDRDAGNADVFKVTRAEASAGDRRSLSEMRSGRQSRSRDGRRKSPSHRQRSSEIGEDQEERRSGRKHRSHMDYSNGDVEERRRASRMRRSEGQIGLPEGEGVSRRHRTERRTRSSDDVYREQRERDRRRGESTGRPSRRADVDKSRMYHSERGARSSEMDDHRRRDKRRDREKSEERRKDRSRHMEDGKGNDVVVDRNEARRLITEMKDRKARRGGDEDDNRRSRREEKDRRKKRSESSEVNDAAAMLAQLKERKARRERGEEVGESPLKLGEKERRRRNKDREEDDGRRRRRDESRRERRPRSERMDYDKNPSSPRSQKSRVDEDGSSSIPFYEELSAVSPRRIPRRYKKYMKESGVSELSKKDIERINLASIVKEASGDNEDGDDGSSADREFIEKIVQKVMNVNKELQEQSGGDLAKSSKQTKPGPVKSNSYRKKKPMAVPTE